MIDTTVHATNKVGLATGKLYKGITIYCESENSFKIYGADRHEYSFTKWSEATAFVDAWYAMQSVIATPTD